MTAETGSTEHSLRELWNELSGAQMLRAIADGRVPSAPHNDHLNLRISEVEPGNVTMTWEPTAAVANPAGVVHGGYVAMTLDDAVCLAGASFGERFYPMLTLNLNIDYLRAVLPGATYTVTSELVHPGNRRMVSNARVLDAEGAVAAQATGSITPNRAYVEKAQQG